MDASCTHSADNLCDKLATTSANISSIASLTMFGLWLVPGCTADGPDPATKQSLHLPFVMTGLLQYRSRPRHRHVEFTSFMPQMAPHASAMGYYSLPWHLITSNSLSQAACHHSAALSNPCRSGECDLTPAVRGKPAKSSGPIAGRMPPVDQGEASAGASEIDWLPRGAQLAVRSRLT